MPATTFPSDAALAEGLASVLDTGRLPVCVINRQVVGYGSFPKELVECRIGRARPLRLFCKYGQDIGNSAYGHRGGPGYECSVYENLLRHSRCSLPEFHGSYQDPRTRETWLVLGELKGCCHLNQASTPAHAMARGAAWLARFHREQALPAGASAHGPLRHYDLEYYLGWARRTRRFSQTVQDRFPWVPTICRSFSPLSRELVDAPQTVIHGEFYPHNVLFRRGRVHPVDWESAAVAIGEIDLVMLTEQWPQPIVRRCEGVYRRIRWPRVPETQFQRWLSLARLYRHLRWLGDPVWAASRSTTWHYRKLRQVGRELGVLR